MNESYSQWKDWKWKMQNPIKLKVIPQEKVYIGKVAKTDSQLVFFLWQVVNVLCNYQRLPYDLPEERQKPLRVRKDGCRMLNMLLKRKDIVTFDDYQIYEVIKGYYKSETKDIAALKGKVSEYAYDLETANREANEAINNPDSNKDNSKNKFLEVATKIVVNDGTTKLNRYYLFGNCKSLVSLTIPDSVVEPPSRLFYENDVPDGLKITCCKRVRELFRDHNKFLGDEHFVITDEGKEELDESSIKWKKLH